jgi:hypothetical protein
VSGADLVFSGQVVIADMFRARFQVDKVWKGESRSEITMMTGSEDLGGGMVRDNSCNFHYRAGERYVVYASGPPDRLLSRGCSRTAVATLAEVQGLDAVVLHRKVGAEIRACAETTSAGGEIRIVTATPTAQPIPSVTLIAEGAGRQYGALTDVSGKSILYGLPAGEYKITANTDGYLAKQSTVNVQAAGCVEASLYLLPIAK